MCGATDGPRRTDFSAASVPGEPTFLRGRSGGIGFGGGPIFVDSTDPVSRVAVRSPTSSQRLLELLTLSPGP